MAAVLAQVRGNAVATHRCDDFRRAHRIGMIAAARVANGRDMVDVHAEAELASFAQDFRLPGLVTGTAFNSAGTSLSA